jgi:hypothetical protein
MKYIDIFNLIILCVIVIYAIRMEITLSIKRKILKQNDDLFKDFILNTDKIKKNLKLFDSIKWYDFRKWTLKQFSKGK